MGTFYWECESQRNSIQLKFHLVSLWPKSCDKYHQTEEEADREFQDVWLVGKTDKTDLEEKG